MGIYSENEESYEYLAKCLGRKIKKKMHDRGWDQSMLAEKTGQSQPTISNILNGKSTVSMKTVFKVMETMEMNPIAEIASCTDVKEKKKEKADGLFELLQKEENIVCNPQDRAFHGYKGIFFVYFHSTNRNEDKCLKGMLEIYEENQHCKVAMQLDTHNAHADETQPKLYSGYVFISKIQAVVYMILVNEEIGEMCFVSFPYQAILTQNRKLECTMGLVLTVSSGIESRRPTVHRIFLSRKELDEESQKYILPQLLLNKSLISISKEQYELMCSREHPQEIFQDAFMHHRAVKEYYEVEEHSFRQILKTTPGCYRDLCMLRQYSNAPKNNKINEGVASSIFHKVIRELI